MRSLTVLALGTLFIIILSACGGTATEVISNPESTADTPEPANTPPPSTPEISILDRTPVDGIDTVPRELAEKAKSDLAGYLKINTDQIKVVEARTVDWPDASLGCPQPDIAYTQAVTPGHWILLEAQGMQYPYHTDMGEQVVLCLDRSPNPGTDTPPLPLIPANPTEIMDGQPWVPVN